jgi:hypothetical protein
MASSRPATFCSTSATVAATMQCAQGCSECPGVTPRGTQDGARGVAGFELRSALRIAVMPMRRGFDACLLDVQRRELRRGGAAVAIEPQVQTPALMDLFIEGLRKAGLRD